MVKRIPSKQNSKGKDLKEHMIFKKAKAEVSRNNDEGKEWNEIIGKSTESRLRRATNGIVRSVNSTLNAMGGQV